MSARGGKVGRTSMVLGPLHCLQMDFTDDGPVMIRHQQLHKGPVDSLLANS